MVTCTSNRPGPANYHMIIIMIMMKTISDSHKDDDSHNIYGDDDSHKNYDSHNNDGDDDS